MLMQRAQHKANLVSQLLGPVVVVAWVKASSGVKSL